MQLKVQRCLGFYICRVVIYFDLFPGCDRETETTSDTADTTHRSFDGVSSRLDLTSPFYPFFTQSLLKLPETSAKLSKFQSSQNQANLAFS